MESDDPTPQGVTTGYPPQDIREKIRMQEATPELIEMLPIDAIALGFMNLK